MLKVNQAAIDALPDAERERFLAQLSELTRAYEQDPLLRFHPCPVHCGDPFCKPHPRQWEFGTSQARLSAVFAGNRFGKTAIGIVKAIVNCLDEQDVPERLRPLRWVTHMPTRVRVVGPDLQAWMNTVLLPELRKWCPRHTLKGDSFDKAWRKQERMLQFKNGSFIQVMTYEMDVENFGGPALDLIWFDEPPPEDIFEECKMRIGTPNGLRTMFTMTPLDADGARAAFVYREIYKRREQPDIEVFRGAIHDNPHLLTAEVDAVLEGRDPNDPRRRAREFGEFMFWGGLVYPGGFEDNQVPPLSREQVKHLDVTVGVDPGLRNAAFIWTGFDRDNRAFVFDELLLQNCFPKDFAAGIASVNRKWGLTGRDAPLYVIDPAAQNRSPDTGQSIEALLQLHGIFAAHGQNDVEAGCLNVLDRLNDKALFVAKNCVELRDEADSYHTVTTPDGKFKVHKDHDHRLDALRYACMSRLWAPARTDQQARQRLGLPSGPGFLPDHTSNPRPPSPDTIVGEPV